MGGKKKAKKAEPKKRGPKLAIHFTCPACNADKSVTCSLKHDEKKGIASCGKCKASYETVIKAIHAPIDVYTKWVDECERLNNGGEDEEELNFVGGAKRARDGSQEPAAPAERQLKRVRRDEEEEAAREDDGEAEAAQDYNDEES